MNAEFNWWLLIVGLVVGAGLVWLVVLDSRRREVDIDEAEGAREAAWLSAVLAEEGHEVSPVTAARLLELHRRFLEAPPPDPVETVAHAEPGEPAADARPASASELADDDRVRVEGGRVDLGQ